MCVLCMKPYVNVPTFFFSFYNNYFFISLHFCVGFFFSSEVVIHPPKMMMMMPGLEFDLEFCLVEAYVLLLEIWSDL